MQPLTAFNLQRWIDEHRHLLKPPVGNKQVFEDAEFIIMVVGGPNARKDYHDDPGAEFFYQLEGDMLLRTIQDGRRVDVPIRQGEILVAPGVPHSPQRQTDTVGLVVERRRRADEMDGFLWYCERCNAVLRKIPPRERHRDAVAAGVRALLVERRAAHLPRLRRGHAGPLTCLAMDWIEISVDGRRWRGASAGVDLAIQLDFHGAQPGSSLAHPPRPRRWRLAASTVRCVGAPAATAASTPSRRIATAHTECVGHLTEDGHSLADHGPEPIRLALLSPCRPTREISRAVLATAAERWEGLPWTALVVRTMPNDSHKRHRHYEGPAPAPWFLPEAIGWMVTRRVASLVVDLPSLDRGDDPTSLHTAHTGDCPRAAAAPPRRHARARSSPSSRTRRTACSTACTCSSCRSPHS